MDGWMKVGKISSEFSLGGSRNFTFSLTWNGDEMVHTEQGVQLVLPPSRDLMGGVPGKRCV